VEELLENHLTNMPNDEFPHRPTQPRSLSYPPTTSKSSTAVRYTTGYPNERFGDVSVAGSAAADGSSRLDPYRKSIQTTKSPPDGGRFAQLSKDAEEDYEKYRGSRFDRLSKGYKTLDNQAEGAEKEYKKYLGTAEKHSQRKRRANPGVYDGTPKETKEWHQKAAQYAYDGAQTYKQ
jgi:hypothetical protein